MSKIIVFPKTPVARPIPCPPTTAVSLPSPAPSASTGGMGKKKPYHRRVACGAWMAAVLVWPLLKWLLAVDVAVKFIEAVMFWHEPGRHAGLVLLAHFGVLTAMTYYVSTRPHDFEA